MSGIGKNIPHAQRQAAGRERLEVYLDAPAAAALGRLVEAHGTKTAAVAAALLEADRAEVARETPAEQIDTPIVPGT